MIGGAADDGLRRLDLDLRERHLFSALMGRPQSVWLNAENAARYRAHLPAALLELPGDRALPCQLAAGLAEDVAHLVIFLCSDDARHITGQVIFVDGGLTLH